MASNRNPHTSLAMPAGLVLRAWCARYDLNLRATMRLNTGSQVVDDPRSWERVLWEGLR